MPLKHRIFLQILLLTRRYKNILAFMSQQKQADSLWHANRLLIVLADKSECTCNWDRNTYTVTASVR